jgi:hypothetical protein
LRDDPPLAATEALDRKTFHTPRIGDDPTGGDPSQE